MMALLYIILKTMTLDEQLDKIGPEYKIQMEKDRQEYFLDVLMKVSDVFKCTKLVNELNDMFPMIKFLETLYTAGFYKGLSYGIETTENRVVDDSDIPVKYGKEIADEINQEILEGTFGTNILNENY